MSVVKQNNYNDSSEEKGTTFESPWEIEGKTAKPPKARENAGDQAVVGFSFVSDKSRK